MTNSGEFLESILHTQHKLYGHELLGLSLFHLSLIDNLCPNLLSRDVSEKDLQLASLICSSKSQKEFQRKTNSLWNYALPLYNFRKQLMIFNEYLIDYMTFPEMNDAEKEGETKNNPFPFSLMFAAKLIKETGWQFDYVFYHLNIAQVFWLISAMSYSETGETNVLSDKEKAIYEVLGNSMTKTH